MESMLDLSGTWKKGATVSKNAQLVIALYANAYSRFDKDYMQNDYSNQTACFAIMKEWVRQNIIEKDYMFHFKHNMKEIENRGYLFEFASIAWRDETSPTYLLVKRTLDEMAEVFNCKAPQAGVNVKNDTQYALEYAYRTYDAMEYNTVRLGRYAYALGVRVSIETADDFFNAFGDNERGW